MSDSLQLTILYEWGDDGWVIASIPEVPGAMSQGRFLQDRPGSSCKESYSDAAGRITSRANA